MRFLISRTSDCVGRNKPCVNAYKREYNNNEIRIGTEWVIDIENLSDLLALDDEIDVDGELILYRSIDKEIPYELEIYDTYRE